MANIHDRNHRSDFQQLYDQNLIEPNPDPNDPFIHLKTAALTLHQKVNLKKMIHERTTATKPPEQEENQTDDQYTDIKEQHRLQQQIQQSNTTVTLTTLATARIKQSNISHAIKQKIYNPILHTTKAASTSTSSQPSTTQPLRTSTQLTGNGNQLRQKCNTLQQIPKDTERRHAMLSQRNTRNQPSICKT